MLLEGAGGGGGGQITQALAKIPSLYFFFGATYAKLLLVLRVTQQGGEKNPSLNSGFFLMFFYNLHQAKSSSMVGRMNQA